MEDMAINVTVDVMLAKRNGAFREGWFYYCESFYFEKMGKQKRFVFSTLEAICKTLDCEPGDILEYKGDEETLNKVVPIISEIFPINIETIPINCIRPFKRTSFVR